MFLRTRSIQIVSSNKLEPLGRNVPGEFSDEVKRIEQMKVLPEILRIGGVKKHMSLDWFVCDFLQRNRRPRHTRKVFLGWHIQDSETAVDDESRIPP